MKPVPPVPRPLSDFALAHAGRPAVVLGGGPSLPDEVKFAPADAVFIGANEHACKLGVRCDYILAVDHIPEKVLPFNVPVITTRRWGQIRMFKQPLPTSGPCAAWAAYLMGCAPIVVVGMDLYLNGTYWHDPKAKSSGNAVSFAHHVARWEKLKALMPNAAIRSVGGPLLKVFPQYRSSEADFSIPTLDEVLKHASGIVVDLTKPIEFKPHRFEAGARVELTESEARQALRAHAGNIVRGVVCA